LRTATAAASLLALPTELAHVQPSEIEQANETMPGFSFFFSAVCLLADL
jgi:hypothetical protein